VKESTHDIQIEDYGAADVPLEYLVALVGPCAICLEIAMHRQLQGHFGHPEGVDNINSHLKKLLNIEAEDERSTKVLNFLRCALRVMMLQGTVHFDGTPGDCASEHWWLAGIESEHEIDEVRTIVATARILYNETCRLLNNDFDTLDHGDLRLNQLSNLVYTQLFCAPVSMLDNRTMALMTIARRLTVLAGLDIQGTCWMYIFDTFQVPPGLNRKEHSRLQLTLDKVMEASGSKVVYIIQVADLSIHCLYGLVDSGQGGSLVIFEFVKAEGVRHTIIAVTKEHMFHSEVTQEHYFGLLNREKARYGNYPKITRHEDTIMGWTQWGSMMISGR